MTIFLLFLAVYRVTRFLTRDQLALISVPRNRFVERWGVFEDAADKKVSITGRRTNVFMRSLAYLWECDWCMSVWVAGAGVYALTFVVSFDQPVLLWLAASAVAGLLAETELLLVKKAQ